MKFAYKSLLVFFVVISFFCCSPKEDVQKHIFLMNQFTADSIIKSQNIEEYRLDNSLRRILRNRNSDINFPSIPLIKKIRCLSETRSALFAPADSIYEFNVRIKRGAVLQFGYALDDIYLSRKRVPVQFKVMIKKKDKGDFQALFQKVLYPGNQDSLGWHDAQIELDNFQGDITLRFETDKVIDETSDWDDLFVYWSHMFVTNPGVQEDKKPNVILISLDALRPDHLDLYGYNRQTAPELTSRKDDFVVFKNCWSQWFMTTESHHSILSGLYEAEHKVPEFYRSTPEHLVMLSEMMKMNGYITGAYTGAGYVGANLGFCKGFDSYFDNHYRDNKKVGFELLESWLRAKKWIMNNFRNNFFLFFHTYEVHAPYESQIPEYDEMFVTYDPEKQKDKLRRRPVGNGLDKVNWYSEQRERLITKEDTEIFQRMRDHYDGSIRLTNDFFLRDLFSSLKELGIYDNTIIVIMSDHGEEFFDHERLEHMDGLYEVNIHIPLIMKLQNSQFGGKWVEENVESIDVFPTLMEILGIPIKHEISGNSFFPLIKEEMLESQGKNYVFSQSRSKFASKKGQTKLLLRGRIDKELRGELARIEIFDLEKDPQEKQAIKTDDLSEHPDLYEAVYENLISKKRGMHIVFSDRLEGSQISGEINIVKGNADFKEFYEIGVTKDDETWLEDGRRRVLFNWNISGWKKSLILVPNENKLRINLRLKIDGKDFTDFIIDESLEQKRRDVLLTRNSFDYSQAKLKGDVILFGNVSQKTKSKDIYFPDLSEENLEKLKALGYIK